MSSGRLLKKAHLRGPILQTGTPRARAALRRTRKNASHLASPCIWTFLSSLSVNEFFGIMLVVGKRRPKWWWAGAESNCRHRDFQSVQTHQRRLTTEMDQQRRNQAFRIIRGFGENLQGRRIATEFDCEVALAVAPDFYVPR